MIDEITLTSEYDLQHLVAKESKTRDSKDPVPVAFIFFHPSAHVQQASLEEIAANYTYTFPLGSPNVKRCLAAAVGRCCRRYRHRQV